MYQHLCLMKRLRCQHTHSGRFTATYTILEIKQLSVVMTRTKCWEHLLPLNATAHAICSFSQLLLPNRLTGGERERSNPDRSPVHRRVDTFLRDGNLLSPVHLTHVFGLCEEIRAPGQNPCWSQENMQKTLATLAGNPTPDLLTWKHNMKWMVLRSPISETRFNNIFETVLS